MGVKLEPAQTSEREELGESSPSSAQWLVASLVSLSGLGLRLASHMFKRGVAGFKGPVLHCAF